jgi:hypothetical protein
LRWAVNLVPQPLYPRKESRFAVRRISSKGGFEEEEIFCPGRDSNIKVNKAEIVPVILCRCASWSVTLGEFENYY